MQPTWIIVIEETLYKSSERAILIEMKILLVDDEIALREAIVFLLEHNFSAKVIEAGSGNQAIKMLTEQKDFDVIISDYKMPDGTGGDLFNYLLKNKISTPFILCSADPASSYPEFTGHTLAGSVEKPFINGPLKKILKDLTPSLAAKPAELIPGLPGFCRIRISSLKRMSALACDLYLRLSGEKFIKIANSGECLEQEDIAKLNDKGLEYLYLPKEHANLFIDKLIREVTTLSAAKEKVTASPHRLAEQILDTIQELSFDLGFTPQIQALTKANVALALVTIESNPKLKSLLEGILLDKNSYISSHSVAVANVACGIAAQMDWQAENIYFKLVLAAFLHDITLTNQELAKLHSEAELNDAVEKSKKFTEKEAGEFLKHPESAATVAKQFEDVPPDVDTIIALHHELPDGSGFPRHLTHANIFPLACVFIVAEDIVNALWEKGNKLDISKYLQEREQLFGFGYFKKIAINMALNFKGGST